MACRIGWGNLSGIWLGRLDNNFRPLRPTFIEVLPYHERESFEDPRLFIHQGRLFLTCALARPSETTQCLAEIDRRFRVVSFCEFRSPENHRVEKNWIFFSHDDQIHAIYHAGRGYHEIHSIEKHKLTPRSITKNPMLWHWGEIRGGSNTVVVDNQYWTFFHSQYKHSGEWRYFMGAYSFESSPPFAITAYTPTPLYSPPELSKSLGPEDRKRVIFPGGLSFQGDNWFIFSGYNDENVVVSRVPHHNLVKLLKRVER